MLDKKFADSCLKEELDDLKENKTLREFLAEYFQYGIEDESIAEAMDDEFADLVDCWSVDNGMSPKEMIDFIMKSLDAKVDYDIRINNNYDVKPYKMGSDDNPYWTKEVCFSCKVIVNDISLTIDEWYKNYEV